MKSAAMSTSSPPMLYMSPTFFLYVLQVKEKEPHMNEAKILLKAQQQMFSFPSPVKITHKKFRKY